MEVNAEAEAEANVNDEARVEAREEVSGNITAEAAVDAGSAVSEAVQEAREAGESVSDAAVAAASQVSAEVRASVLARWAFRVCRNVWIGEYRARRTRETAAQNPELQEGSFDGERQVHASLAVEEVGRALQQLPEDQRLVLALLIGFGSGVWLDGAQPGGDSQWAAVAGQLDHVSSGTEVQLGDEAHLLGRFTFLDQDGRACRQYQLRRGEAITENVACREAGSWQPVATVHVDSVLSADEYRPASAQSLLDGTLSAMMRGGPLGLEEEAEVLGRSGP